MSDAQKPADATAPHRLLEGEETPATQLEQEQNEAAVELNQPDGSGQLNMEVKVYSPFKDYYDGTAFSVSAENLTGPFDVLPGHHNFITLLSACELVVRTTRGEQKIEISGGIMHVKANKAVVFLDV
jgi:hypothetical protein